MARRVNHLRESLTVVLLCVISAGRARGDDVGKAKVREGLDRYWNSIADLEFSCEEFPLDESGRRVPNSPIMIFDFAFNSQGCWSMQVASMKRDGTRWPVDDRRCDGKSTYTHHFHKDHPGVVSLAVKSARSGDDQTRNVTMCYLLSLIMPGGKLLPEHLGQGAELLVRGGGPATGPDARVVIQDRYAPTVCELGPRHDWLPRANLMGPDQCFVTRVTRFGRVRNRFFPVEGTYEDRRRNDVVRRGFRVVNLRINQGVPASRFTFGQLPAGAIVQDRVRLTTTVRGGIAARRRFEQQYPTSTNSLPPAGPPVRATRDPEPGHESLWLGLISASLVAFAVHLKWGRPRFWFGA